MSDACNERFTTWIAQKIGGSMLGEVVVAEVHDAAQSELAALRSEVDRLQRAEKNDLIAYKAAIEKQDELREELASANADKDAYAQNAIDLRTSLDAVTLNLKRADDLIGTRTADLLECGTRRKAAEQRNATLLETAQGLTIQLHAAIGNTEHHEDCIRDLAELQPTESGASE